MDQNDPNHLFDDYESSWLACQGINPEEYLAMNDDDVEVHFSADLTEATYNIPFEVLDANLDICDEIMNYFAPWKTFHKLFRSHEREVDMSQLIMSNYWSGPVTVISKRGSFMGDGMSFIHLTLLLNGLVRLVCQQLDLARPLGQSVGDDLFLLKVKIKFCAVFCWFAERLGCKFSKLNSASEDSGTFCEQYFANVSNLEIYESLKQFDNSIFGDLVFLDTIKGSTLSGNSKVKADGKSPLIGHGQLLNKQIQWNPWSGTKEKATTFLWASNFMEARKLSSAMSSLPQALGGIDIALGTILTYHDDKFYGSFLPYYEQMLNLELDEFLKYYLLLTGIYKANPKGHAWENDWKVISELVQDVVVLDIKNIDEVVPEELRDKQPLVKLRYINEELNLVSFRNLVDEIARRESFHKMWNGVVTNNFMTLKISNVRQRVNQAWAIIKSNLDPVPVENFRSVSMRDLLNKFQERTWGLYVSKEDKKIADVFCGMPSMFMDLQEFTIVDDEECDLQSSESEFSD